MATRNGPKLNWLRWALLALGVVAPVVAASSYYSVGAERIASIVADGPTNLLETTASGTRVETSEARRLVQRDKAAVRMAPLNQGVVNALIVDSARQAGADPSEQAMNVLAGLGWRNRAALFNLLIYYAGRNEVGPTLHVMDAMLRKQAALTEVTAGMLALETLPEYRADVVRVLATAPAWRGQYLLSTAVTLNDAKGVSARFDTLSMLRHSPAPPSLDEVVALLAPLLRVGRAGDAIKLWRSFGGKLDQPLNDPEFSQVSAKLDKGAGLTPFDWQQNVGGEFNVSFAPKLMQIEWNGRAAPVFTSQQTSASRGQYEAVINFVDTSADDQASLDVSLVCPTSRVRLNPVSTSSGDGHLYRANSATPCDYAVFELSGKADAPKHLSIGIQQAKLRRIG